MKLHLGCGKVYIPGYVHIDVVNYPHIEHVCSIDSLTMIEDNSVEAIYNCHVLEHYKRAYIDRVLNEWYRVLKPGGVLRTAVPDFEKICEVYQETKNLDLVIGPIFGRQSYLYNIHYNIFDFTKLSKLLEEAGFKDIKRYDWRKTEHADIDDYSQSYIPHMDKDNGKLISLNIEAIK